MRIRTDLFEDSYEVYEDLGSGQFAVVKRCKHKDTSIEYAAKYVHKRRPNSSSRKGLLREKILQEIEILSDLKHTNIISLHDVFETNTEIILVLELVSGGELFEYISEKDHLTEEEAARFITQILEGVEHFHAKNIVHLDLKPENVMLLDRQDCLIKIIDFGISRKLKPGEKVMETYGTPEFVAPEIIQYQPISTATDMWSIGVITYILLSGASPFLGDTKQETFANITNIDYSFDDEYFGHTSDLAKDFIARLFVKDVRKRANIKDCLEHPWVKPRRKQDEIQRRQAQINIEQFRSFIARRRWKQSALAVCLCIKIIRKSQLRLSSTLSLDININRVTFGKHLLENGDDFVLTALFCASEDGDVRNLRHLLEITPLDVNKTNKNKESALHMAASTGKLDIIKLLHQYKIDLNAQDINGETAIHYCCRCNNTEASKRVIDYLIKNNVSLNVQNKHGETALHIASRYGCTELVRYLCESGANLDIQDDINSLKQQFHDPDRIGVMIGSFFKKLTKDGSIKPTLHVASWHGFPDIVKYFCHFGCDVNIRNKEGETALIVSCARGWIEGVKLLIEYKSDLNCRDKRGNTALHWAVQRHYTFIALILIQAECNMDLLDLNGESALHIACRENLLPVVQTMCAHGCRVDIKNKNQMTPLHTATEKNEIDAVRCLCLAGLDLSITNKDGQTAEQMATSMKHISIANLLSSLRREENREIFIEQLVPTDEPIRRLKVKVFGSSCVGKSTLIGSMKCSYLNSFFRRTRIGTKSTAIKYNSYKRNSLHKIIEDTSQLDDIGCSSSTQLDDSFESDGPNVLDNYEIKNTNYTKGIEISQCTFNGSNHFSIWDFSGYEPYQLFYKNFIDDANCIHLIVYNLNQTQQDCFYECVYWLEFLRSRIKCVNNLNSANSSSQSNNLSSNIYSQSNRSSPLAPSTPTQSCSSTNNTHFPLQNSQHHSSNTNLRDSDSSSSSTQMGDTLNSKPIGGLKVILIGTHADLDKSCTKREDGQYTSEKANSLKYMLENYYSNDDFFDFSEKHFVLDARAACVIDIKLLIQHLIKLKQNICELLPRCTMFLNRTLYHIQNWRKLATVSLSTSMNNLNGSLSASTLSINSNLASSNLTVPRAYKHDPVITWKVFVDEIRRSINPLASDEHLKELVDQLSLMGEIVFLGSELICYQPEWLCQQLLGSLFSYERYSNIRPSNLNGIYSMDELNEMFMHLSSNGQLIKNILVMFDLCAEWVDQKSGELLFEFAALNFLSEPMPLAFHSIKNVASAFLNHSTAVDSQPTLFIVNGFQIRASAFHVDRTINPNVSSASCLNISMTSSTTSLNYIGLEKYSSSVNGLKNGLSFQVSQLASLFFLIQVNLRYLANKSNNIEIENQTADNKRQSYQIQNQQQNILRRNQSEPPPNGSVSQQSTANILKSPSATNNSTSMRFSTTNSNAISQTCSDPINDSFLHLNGALIDMELYQTRYCSRLVRKSCQIECLLSLDHVNGQFIELRACAPDAWREELFYFIEDLYSFVEHVISEACVNINLEKHYLSFKPVLVQPNSNIGTQPHCSPVNLGVVTYDALYSPREIVYMQFQNKSSLINTKRNIETKFFQLACCGSEIIERMLIYGIDMPLLAMNPYTKHMLCVYLDKKDPMGLDWSILAVMLGLQDILPKVDELCLIKHFSKTEYVLNEWCKIKQEQATIRNLLGKIADMGRKDVFNMLLNTIELFRCGICKDSGIQNSNQTLASIK